MQSARSAALGGTASLIAVGAVGAFTAVVISAALIAAVLAVSSVGSPCAGTPSGAPGSVALGPPGTGQRVGATEYGGPGDPSSGTVGASGANLLEHPDSYAELGGTTFETATAMGGLPYMTPLRITWGHHSAVAYKRDFGLGGGPIAGLPRVIDLWWEFASALGIPYEHGEWSGPVTISRPPPAGAGNVLAQTAPAAGAVGSGIGLRPVRSIAGPGGRRPAEPRPAGAAAPGRARVCAGISSGRDQGDHRGRQSDRWQAVSVRRRSWAAA